MASCMPFLLGTFRKCRDRCGSCIRRRGNVGPPQRDTVENAKNDVINGIMMNMWYPRIAVDERD